MAWPVTVAEAKAHSYITTSDEDALIESLIGAACEEFEQITGMALTATDYPEPLEVWPADPLIVLPRWPLNSVASVVYTDADGTEATLSASDYWVDTYSKPGRIWLHRNKWWPSVTLRPGPSIVISYNAGYASADVVPDLIKRILLVMFADLYEHREATVVGAGLTATTLEFVWRQIDNWRRRAV